MTNKWERFEIGFIPKKTIDGHLVFNQFVWGRKINELSNKMEYAINPDDLDEQTKLEWECNESLQETPDSQDQIVSSILHNDNTCHKEVKTDKYTCPPVVKHEVIQDIISQQKNRNTNERHQQLLQQISQQMEEGGFTLSEMIEHPQPPRPRIVK